MVPPGNYHESPTEYYLQTIANMTAQTHLNDNNGKYKRRKMNRFHSRIRKINFFVVVNLFYKKLPKLYNYRVW